MVTKIGLRPRVAAVKIESCIGAPVKKLMDTPWTKNRPILEKKEVLGSVKHPDPCPDPKSLLAMKKAFDQKSWETKQPIMHFIQKVWLKMCEKQEAELASDDSPRDHQSPLKDEDVVMETVDSGISEDHISNFEADSLEFKHQHVSGESLKVVSAPEDTADLSTFKIDLTVGTELLARNCAKDGSSANPDHSGEGGPSHGYTGGGGGGGGGGIDGNHDHRSQRGRADNDEQELQDDEEEGAASAPPFNPKGRRIKRIAKTTQNIDPFPAIIGNLSLDNNNSLRDLDPGGSISGDDISTSLLSIMKHPARCQKQINKCSTCGTMLQLLTQHIALCRVKKCFCAPYTNISTDEELRSAVASRFPASFPVPDNCDVHEIPSVVEEFTDRSPIVVPDELPAPAFVVPSLPLLGTRNPLRSGLVLKTPLVLRKENCVRYGEARELHPMLKKWEKIKDDYQHKGLDVQDGETEGIIFDHKRMKIVGGCYDEKTQWMLGSALGSGVSATAYVATDIQSQSIFCVKQIHISRVESDEFTILASLSHPFIVKMCGATFDRRNSMVNLFMEYIHGSTLQELIDEQIQLNSWLAMHLLQQLLKIVEYLQSVGIMHEDIKADNIIVNESYGLRLIDFGLAQRTDQGEIAPGETPIGAQTQWSPEKATCNGYDHRSDMWAAVCTFVHSVAGCPPWVRRFEGIKALMYIIGTKSPPLEDIPDGLPSEVVDLITQAWRVEVKDRPHPREVMQHKAFNLLRERHITDPIFTAHFTETPESIFSSEISGEISTEISTEISREISTENIQSSERSIPVPEDTLLAEEEERAEELELPKLSVFEWEDYAEEVQPLRSFPENPVPYPDLDIFYEDDALEIGDEIEDLSMARSYGTQTSQNYSKRTKIVEDSTGKMYMVAGPPSLDYSPPEGALSRDSSIASSLSYMSLTPELPQLSIFSQSTSGSSMQTVIFNPPGLDHSAQGEVSRRASPESSSPRLLLNESRQQSRPAFIDVNEVVEFRSMEDPNRVIAYSVMNTNSTWRRVVREAAGLIHSEFPMFTIHETPDINGNTLNLDDFPAAIDGQRSLYVRNACGSQFDWRVRNRVFEFSSG